MNGAGIISRSATNVPAGAWSEMFLLEISRQLDWKNLQAVSRSHYRQIGYIKHLNVGQPGSVSDYRYLRTPEEPVKHGPIVPS